MDPLPRKPTSACPPLSTRVGHACFFPQNFLPAALCRDRNLPFKKGRFPPWFPFQGNLLRRARFSQRESGAPASSRKTSRPPPCAETGTCLSKKEGSLLDFLPQKLLRRARLSQRESGAPASSRKTSCPQPCAETGTCLSEKEGPPLDPLPGKPASAPSPLPAKPSAVPILEQELLFGKTLKKTKADSRPFGLQIRFLKFCFFPYSFSLTS